MAKKAKTRPRRTKYVYSFGGGKAEGHAGMKNLLGGKGANLAEMTNLGVPVPPGFTISTEMCTVYQQRKGTFPSDLRTAVNAAMRKVERIMGVRFGDPDNPLLVSVRSGARQSMPGMMETVLNVGLNDTSREGLIRKTGNPRFVYDAQRRLIQMYSDVVMEKAAGIEPTDGMGIRRQLERELARMKKARDVTDDTDLTADDLKTLIATYKKTVKRVLGTPFPEDPMDQLWGAIGAVFASWNGKRAIEYRRIEGIPGEWGTAVNVQAMVFGNMGETSATGVAFTRNPATGEDQFYGEWLANAQGEDVVAGIRTPNPVNEAGKTPDNKHLPSLETAMPRIYKQLDRIQRRLEKHYHDMQDIEFTIQDGRLWLLQTRTGKRNGVAAVRMAVEMAAGRLISAAEAVQRVKPDDLVQVLLPMVDPKAERAADLLAKGLPAGPGGAAGQVVFTADEAASQAEAGKMVILVREETSPEDVHGMWAAEAILTARGGMTSHAALVARGWGKCCIVGCSDIEIDERAKTMIVAGRTVREGDWITLNGTLGAVYADRLPLVDPDLAHNQTYGKLMALCDRFRRLGIRTNADTPGDAKRARQFGAEGIGLLRTEHMFYGEGAEEPLFKLRKMILSKTEAERRAALKQLFRHMKTDVKGVLRAMDGLPVTIRFLDPPLHEFVPKREEGLKELADSLGVSLDEVRARAETLHESNPMMGHRGCRLGVTYPEIPEMQARAVLEATAELVRQGRTPMPEIMIPVTGMASEVADQAIICRRVEGEVLKKYKMRTFPYFLVGTMIEIPRAALTANEIAETAEFFSYGTNDLTQMGFGFSRDDIGAFLPDYLKKGLLPADPFQTIDVTGIGELIQIGIERGRRTRPDLKVGICGEHGGDAESVKFCHRVGMDYVSCSPFRIPIARLAAAQAALEDAPPKKATKGRTKAKRKRTGGKRK